MKNYYSYLLLIVAFILSGCAITKQSAPIVYNHNNSNLGDSKKLNENTITVVSNEGEIISSKLEDSEISEVIKPTSSDNENYALPATKPFKEKVISSDIKEDKLEAVIIPEKIKADKIDANHKIINHTVKEGETIEEIAGNYNQTVEDIAQINNFTPPYYLEEDSNIKIKIPNGFSPKQKLPILVENNPIKQVQIVADYIKPVEGSIITMFGEKTEHGVNKGINIAAPEGTQVLASANGKVIYADYDATFGNLVIIKLDNKNIVLSYAHLEDLIVSKGSNLKQGDIVGYIGNSGKIKQPQLHFAVREGKNAVDPLKFVHYSPKQKVKSD